MGKTRDPFKKIRDAKGTFNAKMGTIKNRNVMDIIEEIKKRWQEYMEELCKKDLHDPDNYDGVISHLEPDIPECVHGILQARILELIAFPFSRGSSQPTDWTQVSGIAGRFFTS